MSEDQNSDSGSGGIADLSDRRIGEFQLLRRLGSGGMADVYLAEQTSLGRHVAVKILKTDSLQGNAQVLSRRFEQEARAAGSLSHPNLVQIITTGHDADLAYIVQEYIPGLNLSQWIRRNGSPEYGLGLKWMLQITSALRAAAEAGVIHRDIKPENILLTHQDDAKVTDFGLAQLNRPESQPMNLTQDGTTMGTPWYMSPEQIQGNKLDARCDQYSLGVTAWHMFAGEPPFPGRNAMTVAAQHLKDKAPSLATMRADLPLQFCAIIERMMQKRPEERFPDFAALEQALSGLRSVSVNVSGLPDTGWRASLTRGLQPLRMILPVLGVCVLASYAAARLLTPEIVISLKPDEQSAAAPASATHLYMTAMLNPDRQDLWREIAEQYPDTIEADMAELQLAVTLMSVAQNPEGSAAEMNSALNDAQNLFGEIREKGLLMVERNYLEIIGMVGQEWVLTHRPETEQQKLDLVTVRNQIAAKIDEYRQKFGKPEAVLLDMDRAPRELRDYFSRARARMLEGADEISR